EGHPLRLREQQGSPGLARVGAIDAGIDDGPCALLKHHRDTQVATDLRRAVSGNAPKSCRAVSDRTASSTASSGGISSRKSTTASTVTISARLEPPSGT